VHTGVKQLQDQTSFVYMTSMRTNTCILIWPYVYINRLTSFWRESKHNNNAYTSSVYASEHDQQKAVSALFLKYVDTNRTAYSVFEGILSV